MTRTRLPARGLPPRTRKRLTTRDQIVGDVLRRARIARGLSQGEAAEAYGLRPQAFISKVERGARHVHPHELQRFAALYGVPVQDLETSIDLGLRLADAEHRRVRKTRQRRRIVEHPEEAGLFIEVAADGAAGGAAEAGAGEPAGRSGVGGEGSPSGEEPDEEETGPEDEWPLVGDTSGVSLPGPLRPTSVPFALPPLVPADRERRERLSRLVEEGAGAVLAGLTAEWLPVIDAYGLEGSTPLYEAVVAEQAACVEALVALGANPFRVQCFPWAADAREVTPFNAAIRTSDPSGLLRLLCAAGGAAPAERDGWARGAVHWAAIEALSNGAALATAVRKELPGWITD